MQKHRTFLLTCAGLGLFALALLYMVRSRTPDDLGPIGVAVFFIIVYGFLAQCVSLLITIFDYVDGRARMPVSERIGVSLGSTLPIVMLLALNTIRQITIIDLLLAGVFGVVLVFYLRRR